MAPGESILWAPARRDEVRYDHFMQERAAAEIKTPGSPRRRSSSYPRRTLLSITVVLFGCVQPFVALCSRR